MFRRVVFNPTGCLFLCFPVFKSPALQSTAGRGRSTRLEPAQPGTVALWHCGTVALSPALPAERGRGSPPARPALGHRPQTRRSLGSRRLLQSRASAPRSQSGAGPEGEPRWLLAPPVVPQPRCHRCHQRSAVTSAAPRAEGQGEGAETPPLRPHGKEKGREVGMRHPGARSGAGGM